jgi:hypothetical protein
VKASIRKNPWAWVIGAAIVGGLFLSNFIKGGAAKIRSKV